MIALVIIILVDLLVVVGLMYFGLKSGDHAKPVSHHPETSQSTAQPRQRDE